MWVTVSDVQSLLPRARPEISWTHDTAAFQEAIDGEAVWINRIANLRGFTLPTVQPVPVTNQWLLLECFQLRGSAGRILFNLSSSLFPALESLAIRRFRIRSDYYEARAEAGIFDGALAGLVVDTAPLAALSDVYRLVPGFRGDSNIPSQASVTRQLLRYSAFAYAICFNRGLYIDLTEGEQARYLNQMVARLTAIDVVIAREQLDNPLVLNNEVAALEELTQGQIKSLILGADDWIFG